MRRLVKTGAAAILIYVIAQIITGIIVGCGIAATILLGIQSETIFILWIALGYPLLIGLLALGALTVRYLDDKYDT